MSTYSMFFQYDPTDRVYVGNIAEIPGCKAHGSTIEDAMKELKISLELWLETAANTGIEIPQPRHLVNTPA